MGRPILFKCVLERTILYVYVIFLGLEHISILLVMSCIFLNFWNTYLQELRN